MIMTRMKKLVDDFYYMINYLMTVIKMTMMITATIS